MRVPLLFSPNVLTTAYMVTTGPAAYVVVTVFSAVRVLTPDWGDYRAASNSVFGVRVEKRT